MRGINKFFQFTGLGLMALLALCPASASASIWLSQADPASGCCTSSNSPDKTFYIVSGEYPKGALYTSSTSGSEDTVAYAVDPGGKIHDAYVDGSAIHFRAPLQGHHWLFYQQRELRGDTLHVSLAKYRFYNQHGDAGESILKEIRGRTIDSKFGRPPVEVIPFEIILQKPLQDHHISCCMYSGDTVRLKIFHDQQPLSDVPVKVVTDTGWSAALRPGADEMVSFEIPRNTYVDTTKDKHHKQHLLITADYAVDAEGSYQGQPYRRVHYSTTEPIDFGPSPLEWAAKMPAFLVVFAVILVCGFGVFLYRLWIRKRRLASA
ncbi:hypothetical protein [Thiohalobacter sp. COW1]|uniref:hypothetical protein n=1 Tax=Thiohalobacter sp. COW1 TaxID=2795687 RepID=UPI0019162B69|nr:hypothetical protein [Thiohalobacter sp. COW1]